MIPLELLQVVERDLHYVVSVFNGAPNLVDAMRGLGWTDADIVRRLYLLLSHPEEVKVISPWAQTFPLFDELTARDAPWSAGEELYGNASITPGSPYSVHTIDGELLYRVLPHGGWFGTSTLDRTLLLQSFTGDMYYLQYQTFTKPYTYLLLINNQSIGQLSINPPGLVEPAGIPNTLPADNRITFSTTRKGRLEVRYLISTPITIPSTTLIRQQGVVEYHTLEEWDDKFMWFPHGAGWLAIFQDGVPLRLGDIMGAGVDRVIAVNDYVLYIAQGNIDMTSVRQVLGETVRRPPDLSRAQVIQAQVRVL